MSPPYEINYEPKLIVTTPITSKTKPKTVPNAPTKKKKKKKKNTYKSMMADIMKPTRTNDERKEDNKEHIAKSLGGGKFKKFDKL